MVVKMIETVDNNCVSTFMNVRNFEIFGSSLILDFQDGKTISLPVTITV